MNIEVEYIKVKAIPKSKRYDAMKDAIALAFSNDCLVKIDYEGKIYAVDPRAFVERMKEKVVDNEQRA